jgi:cytidylate kinase
MAGGGAICISHETGARGEAVARLVAEHLGFRYADEEVIAEAADWAELDPAFVADAERRKPLVDRILGNIGGRSSSRLPMGGEASRALPSEGDLRALIRTAVATVAREGAVVIVAHAASYAVGENALRVLVTASPSTRAAQLADARGIGVADAEKSLREEDAGRADYLKRFYGIDREQPSQYDVVVNTDRLSPEDAAAVVIAAARRAGAGAVAAPHGVDV